MKSLTDLWLAMAEDYSAICDTPIERDYQTVLARVEEEGLSFLTITLPAYCTDFESCLSSGRIGSNRFLGFKRRGGLPAFMSGFLLQIFDGQSLELLSEPSVNAIRAVRNLSLLCKKIEMDCSDERNAAALDGFLACENDLALWEIEKYPFIQENYLADLTRIFAVLFGDTMNMLSSKIESFELVPSHGPGSTADRKVGNGKFVQTEWTERLEEYFPFGRYALPSWKHFAEYTPAFLTPEQERPVKVHLVPKTQTAPRIIGLEPVCMQYMQQALLREMKPSLEGSSFSGPFVHFTDQSLNQEAARAGSIDGSLATLDLSEASDRVSNRLVHDLMSPWPSVRDAVQACRSTSAELPDGRLVAPLSKFASMGSALTFPVEMMVFTAIIFLALERITGDKITVRLSLAPYRGLVHVYGDDMIVPADSVNVVVWYLEEFFLKVNRKKSFTEGNFRESCGGDYFAGESVKPIRLKQLPPTTRQDVAHLVSWNSFMNAAYAAGMRRTGDRAKREIEGVLGEHLKDVPLGSQALGVQTDDWIIPVEAMHPHLQVPVMRAPVVVYKQRKAAVDDVWALQKALTGSWYDPENRDHLLHSGRPLSSRIKNSWVPIRFSAS